MQSKIERLHFMDSMRAILMVLGVVLHSAQIFNPEQNWVIYSNNTDSIMAYIVSFISMFRMPAFFVVAGYFCFLTIKKYPLKIFLTLRFKRLLIPFFFTALIINSFQVAFLNWIGWQPFELLEYLANGEYISHLWFLINLAVYFLCVGLIVILFKAKPKTSPGVDLCHNILKKIPVLAMVFIMPLFTLGILALNKTSFPLYSSFFGVFNTYTILLYVPFFIFGVALATDRNFLERFCSVNPFACVAIISISLGIANLIIDINSIFFLALSEYLFALSQWFSVLVCFYGFYHFCNKQSKLMRMLSDSSYTVYLFHHILVIIFGTFLVHFGSSALVSCLLLISIVTVLTLIIHKYLIAKNKVLLFMFNGR